LITSLQIVTAFLASIAWALALSHALEWPGKLRLDEDAYAATQTIYYPGFTIGAAVGEAGGIVATCVLLLFTGPGTPQFALTLAALLALLAMHATYWLVTHPVNKFWLRGQQLGRAGAGFFGIGRRGRETPAQANPHQVWVGLRWRWECSHAVRAAFSGVALACLLVAMAL
jgi:hypothetical protein